MKPSATGRESIAADHRDEARSRLALRGRRASGGAARGRLRRRLSSPRERRTRRRPRRCGSPVAIGAAAGLWPVAAAVDAASALAARLAAGEEGGAGAPPRRFPDSRRRCTARSRGSTANGGARRERTAGAIARHEAILDALRDPLLLLDDSRVVVFANRAAGGGVRGRGAGRPPSRRGGARGRRSSPPADARGRRSGLGAFRAGRRGAKGGASIWPGPAHSRRRRRAAGRADPARRDGAGAQRAPAGRVRRQREPRDYAPR